jgi:CheY-like chemotaxis protein
MLYEGIVKCGSVQKSTRKIYRRRKKGMITKALQINMDREEQIINRKVLVVDNEFIVGIAASLELNRAGYETRTASNGRQALEMILGAMEGENQVPFDLLLTDINMPVMSGLELLAELRKREINIPVVIMTGNASDCQDLRASSGRLSFLKKPFSTVQLIDEVKNILAKHGLAAPEK